MRRLAAIVRRREWITIVVLLAVCGGLLLLDLRPARNPEPGTKERARVLTVDNTNLYVTGLLQRGEQNLEVEILSGKLRGQHFRAVNILRAQMELDKIFHPGDTIRVAVLTGANPEKDTLYAQDFDRIGWTLLLFGLFAVLLIVFAGWTGVNALLSFVFSGLFLWKVLIPLTLDGGNAIWLSLGTVCVLSAVIIYLVAGVNRKGNTALAGAILGVTASAILAYCFTHFFRINGAVMPYSQALLFSGYEFLKLPDIYIGGIFLASSGAMMDLAMDIAAGQEELSRRNPELTFRQLLHSGQRIGRAVVGTMTTTLLLAYSGGYLTLMMMFAAQGTTPADFINNPYVASETVKTIVGSFGLVLVAPFTVLVGAYMFSRKKKHNGRD